jgi:replicative DNA helicase
LNIEIDDTAGISISALRSAARAMVKRGAKIIIVDYLQLMTAHTERGGNREQEISAISRGLKGMAKELGVPVIALSQLSRAVELRSDKKPQLSDLRESGAIEQDADVVSFLYRPEYYNIKEDEQGNSTKGICEFIIAKHRNGAVDTVLLRFNSETTTFYNYSQLQPVFATTFPADTPAMVGARSGDGDIPF